MTFFKEISLAHEVKDQKCLFIWCIGSMFFKFDPVDIIPIVMNLNMIDIVFTALKRMIFWHFTLSIHSS